MNYKIVRRFGVWVVEDRHGSIECIANNIQWAAFWLLLQESPSGC